MIPLWLLSLLHYVSLSAAAIMLGLLAWHYLREGKRSSR